MDVGALDSGWGWGIRLGEQQGGLPVQGRLSLQWPCNKRLSRMERSGSAVVTAAALGAWGGASWSGRSWVEARTSGPMGALGCSVPVCGSQRASGGRACGLLRFGNEVDCEWGHVVHAGPPP